MSSKNYKILVAIAPGTEETEAVTIIDILRRAGFSVVVAGSEKICKCSRGVTIIADVTIEALQDFSVFDAIILPGGAPGVEVLCKNQVLINAIKAHHDEKKLIGAICAAPLILKEEGLINDDVRLTGHPTIKVYFNETNFTDATVQINDNIITSRGLGTAIDFTLSIIKILSGADEAHRISQEIIYTRDIK